MRLQSLKHLIEVIYAVARPAKICILGSSSLLPEHPDLGEQNRPLDLTTDADLLLEPVNEGIAESLQLAAGRDSAFMARFGYYADILRPTIAETLPTGWEERLHPVTGYDNVFTLDPYDLAIVKLMVGRKKDLDLLRALLALKIIAPDRLRRHYQTIPLNENESFAIGCACIATRPPTKAVAYVF
ncbi:MAG: hypothetical protein HY360_12370 [Verrucomicrobia bacterium]|nr:hypothetical protein [Verrucomicrobiota bacterium]